MADLRTRLKIGTADELAAGFTDADIDPAHPWGSPHRYSAAFARLRAVEAAAREVINETVIIKRGEFATFEGHWCQVEKFAIEELSTALGDELREK